MTSNDSTASYVVVPRTVVRNPELSPGAKACYLLLADADGGATTQASLAVALGCSERSLRNYLGELVASETVTVERQVDEQGQHANRYIVAGHPARQQVATPARQIGDPPATSCHPNKEQNSPKGSAMGTTPPTQTSSSLPPIDGQLFDAPPEPRPTKRRTRLPDDFAPSERMLAWASETCPRVDPDLETAQFRDHHQAKGSTMSDWPAAWRTWMRNAQKWQTPNVPARRSGGVVDLRSESTTDRALRMAGITSMRRRP